MRKRITSLFLVLVMCLTLLPTAVLAEDTKEQAQPASAETSENETLPESAAEVDETVLSVQAQINALPGGGGRAG